MAHDQTNSDDSKPRGEVVLRVLGRLGWALVGAIFAVVLVTDPFDLHPIDSWLRGMGTSEQGASQAMSAMDSESKQLWTCSLHPNILEEEPGECPICGTTLVPVAAAAEPTTAQSTPASSGDREILFYRNPMDPTISSPVPMKDGMGMDYVPVYADEVDTAVSQGAVVSIDPSIVQNMNVQTAVAERGAITHHIRTVGYLEYDQQRMVSITTKYSGWIEKVQVNYVGEPVRKGQPLFEIYSPELVQTQQELLSALEYARRIQDAPDEVRRRAEDLVDAARVRLSYWDITPEQVEHLEQHGEVVRTLTVTAPVGGVVMKRMPGLEGMAVKPGMELFHIAGLSSLWLSVEVFEDQLAFVRVGSKAKINFSYFPGETFEGRVRFIEPEVSEKTRTVALQVEVPNPRGKLRAGMYATVVFDPVVAEHVVTVPSLAVIRTGERDLVIVQLEEGRFSPRDVVLGHEGAGQVEVLEGLEEGEEVVTSGQFLIDSEANLQEAIQKMIAQRVEHADR